jgi:hypothetical protein
MAMEQHRDDAERLLTLYREKGDRLSLVRRFYLHLDPDTYDLELEVEESEAAGYFREKLIDLYESWLREMTPEQRAELFTQNRLAGGANTNWLVADEERLSQYADGIC